MGNPELKLALNEDAAARSGFVKLLQKDIMVKNMDLSGSHGGCFKEPFRVVCRLRIGDLRRLQLPRVRRPPGRLTFHQIDVEGLLGPKNVVLLSARWRVCGQLLRSID